MTVYVYDVTAAELARIEGGSAGLFVAASELAKAVIAQ
jgi:hypothetical protein